MSRARQAPPNPGLDCRPGASSRADPGPPARSGRVFLPEHDFRVGDLGEDGASRAAVNIEGYVARSHKSLDSNHGLFVIVDNPFVAGEQGQVSRTVAAAR